MITHLIFEIGITTKKRPSLGRQKGVHLEKELGFTMILVIKYISSTRNVSLNLVSFSPMLKDFNGYSQNWVSWSLT